MYEFLMRHNPFREYLNQDSGDGQGGGSSTTGADTKVTAPASGPLKTGGDTNNDDKASLENLLSTNPNFKAELDRYVGKAVSTREKNLLADFEKQKEDAVKDALEEASLSQKEKDKKAEEKRLKDIADREAAIKEGERKLLIVNKLSELKLPIEFRDYITATEEEGILEQIKGITAIIDKRVAEIAQEKLKTAAVDVTGKEKSASGDDAIIAEYNTLASKDKLNPVEQRRLNEITDKVRLIRSGKGDK